MSSVGLFIFIIVVISIIKSVMQAMKSLKTGQDSDPSGVPPAPTPLEEVLQRELQRQLDKRRQGEAGQGHQSTPRADFPPQPTTLESLENWPPRRMTTPAPEPSPRSVPQARQAERAPARVTPRTKLGPMAEPAGTKPTLQPAARVKVIPGVERRHKRVQLKPRSVRQAILLSEVLAPPLALRPQARSTW